MIRSMTGFGAADGTVGGGRVSVEIRSVNHRFFNPSIKLPSVLARWEADVREALRRRVSRGHVTLSARFEREGEDDASPIDESRFAAYVAQLRALQERYDLDRSLDVGTVLRMHDVFAGATREELPAEAGPALLAIVDRAADALLEMRGDEGRRLADKNAAKRIVARRLRRARVQLLERHLQSLDQDHVRERRPLRRRAVGGNRWA